MADTGERKILLVIYLMIMVVMVMLITTMVVLVEMLMTTMVRKNTSGDLMATTLWGSNATASKLTKVKLYFWKGSYRYDANDKKSKQCKDTNK